MVLGLCPALALADEVVVADESEGIEESVTVVQDEVDDAEELEVQATSYPIYVGGKQVTPDNCKDVFGDGKVSYDATSHTMTLNGYEYSGEGHSDAGIYYSHNDTLTIKLVGKNSVKAPSYGICSYRSIVIDGTGTLEAAATSGNDGIYVSGDVTINGGNVTAIGSYYGIHSATSENTIEINGGTVIATGGDYALSAANLTIAGGTVTATGKYALSARKDGTLTIADGISVKAGADKASAKDVDPKEFSTYPNFMRYSWVQTSSGVPVQSVTVNPAKVTLTEGDTKVLKATVKPSGATDKDVTWTSSNTSVAKVNAKGKVTAVAAGKATITATAGGKSGTCVVTVKKKPAKASKPTTQAHPSAGTIDAAWKAVSGAKSYELSWRVAGGKWKTKAVSGTEETLKGLKKGKLYQIRVRAVAGSAKGKWSTTSKRWLRSTSKVKVKTGDSKGSIKVSWKADKKATAGYQVRVYAKKGGKLVKTARAKAGETSVTVGGLKSGKKYFVRMRVLRAKGSATYTGALCSYRGVRAK